MVGTVQRCSRRGFFGNPGKLEFSIDEAQAVDGVEVELRATEAERGRDNRTAAIATGVLLFVPALLIKGRDVSIEKGQEFTALVDQDVVITSRRRRVGTFPPPAPPARHSSRICTLHLKNGDKVTGMVDGPHNGVYTVVTSSGTLTIAQANVAGVAPKGSRS